MIFNSIDFAFFLPIVYILYWYVLNRRLRIQNLFLLIVSLVFYGWWSKKFLLLIGVSTLIDYFVGIALSNEDSVKKRKLLLWISVIVNLGLLGFFKYYNFFVENFVTAFSFFGMQIPIRSLNIVLPVGISFYTFQTMSYTIDVYKRKLEPTKDIVAFGAFISFFPQLVAGPIERASNLLPQFYSSRKFDYQAFSDGMRQILWGLFKKVVVADNCATYVNLIFENPADYSGSSLFLAGALFAIQIYGDFSGYSDIAIGTARLFGFSLMRNFAFPYFSRDVGEFWRRWHISLSTWFRDYLYIPLGGSREGKLKQIRNTFLLFVVSGFWHGANWTFIIWGLLNAVYFLPLLLKESNRVNINIVANTSLFPKLEEVIKITFTFFLTVIAWIFFRSKNVEAAFDYIYRMFSNSLFEFPELPPIVLIFFILILFFVEWINRAHEHALGRVSKSRVMNWICYLLLSYIIAFFMGEKNSFIYFQF